MAKAWSLGLLVLALLIAVVHGNSEKMGLFIFGDSTVDCGTNDYIDTTMDNRANYHPYGEDGPLPFPTGRFSNARVAPDFIARLANMPPIPPFLQPNADFSFGANFASGGAGVLSGTNQGLVVDLATQLAQFLDIKKKLSNTHIGGVGGYNTWFENSVYYMSIGSNDYLIGYLSDAEALETYTADEFRQFVIGNLSQAIQFLYDEGARKFFITSVSDLGCLPGVRAITTNGSCLEIATYLSITHNIALQELLADLSKLEGFKYTFLNLQVFLTARTDDPLKYGFLNGIDACCGSGPFNGLNTCGGKNNVTKYNLCMNASTHVWFDSYHCSEPLHKQVSEVIWEGNDPSVKSIPLKDLFSEELLILSEEI